MDTTITGLPTASGIDPLSDWFAIDRTSLGTTQKINRNTILGISGSPVGTSDTQTLTNKILGNTNTITLKDTLLTLQDDGDITKQGRFNLSAVTTGQTRTYTLPNASVTLASVTGTETLTNKTLTSPIVTGGSITGSTIATDVIIGQSVANSGTIYGATITSGVVASAALLNTVNTAALQGGSVTPNKLATGATTAFIATSETTTSATFTDLSTPGPAVTVTIGANGLAFVSITAEMTNNTINDFAVMGFAVSGATTIAAVQTSAAYLKAAVASEVKVLTWAQLVTGLASGSTTFTAKYERITGGTAGFTNRRITVIPL